ncbi:peptidoglycan-binding domain-containing protein [Cellulomonas alba]|uniref:Peptidoglycan-binding domain-containing protein n=1 Tax=Cellulomonas alba TaxID=3053467 RepID=A0ABT7SFI9_9CELL|nr:peptidoglycan-binding domain-containing protein [Cellulomonas alba]MDM7854963.1 peptidoglycan-binding domain-containing protein [Cellulomonas alba]
MQHTRPRARTALLVAVATAALLTGACSSGDPDSAVARAEAQVSAKQKALDDAEANATKTTAAFCSAGTDYVRAIDRYGDLLTTETTTVGDVRTAGGDLAAPRGDAVSAGQSAVQAREEVATAHEELARAQADLAQAQATASGTTAPQASLPDVTATPVASADAVARVQKADEEFTAAMQGVSDSTPLRQAAVAFNSAAVALEMSWLQLVVDAGCLTDDQAVEAQKQAAAYTKALQQQLADAEYYDDDVDGTYGPKTVAAVEALQKAHGLPLTGTVDKATDAALRADVTAKGGATARADLTSTAALQQTLHLAGYWDGPVDGTWTPELEDALKKAQDDLGVEPTGEVDAATVAAFEKALGALTSDEGQPPATPAPSASAG